MWLTFEAENMRPGKPQTLVVTREGNGIAIMVVDAPFKPFVSNPKAVAHLSQDEANQLAAFLSSPKPRG